MTKIMARYSLALRDDSTGFQSDEVNSAEIMMRQIKIITGNFIMRLRAADSDV